MIEKKSASMPSIAVVVLTWNEEINLQRCLDSVKWANELIVLDSGSQDRTLEIAKKNGARVLSRQIEPFIISEQRNYALDAGDIHSDWVLFIDADEVLTEALYQKLLEILNNTQKKVVAYRLAPKYMFLGRWLKHCQGYPSWHDRLLRYGKARFTGGVWESFETTGQVDQIDEPYLHYSLNKGIGAWFAKHERYATVEAIDILATLGTQIDSPYNQRTARKRTQRNLAARFWPLRPVMRFIVMYFLRLGFLDGLPGLLYSLMIVCYEFMVVLKVIEFRRREKGLPI